MKKTMFWSICMLMVMTMPFLVACGDDNESNNDVNAALLASYQKTKANIVGTWILEANYTHSTSNPYIKLGWDNNDEYGFFQLNPYYQLSFKSDGTFTDKNGESFTYSIEVDENKTVYYNSVKQDYDEYWPFAKGIVKLVFDNSFEKKAYCKYVLVEIKNDGMLYFYKMSQGSEGIPDCRLKKI